MAKSQKNEESEAASASAVTSVRPKPQVAPEWQNEVEALRGMQIKSLDQAFTALFEQLGRKFGPLTEDEKTHLRLLMESDPKALTTLNGLIK